MAIIRQESLYDLQTDQVVHAGAPSRKNARADHSPILVKAMLFFLILAIYPFFASSAYAQQFGCSPAMANDIVCENTYPGTPASVWDTGNGSAGDPTIQGFATDISVAQGGTISFKVNTSAKAYTLQIYRMGYYGGDGARLITTITPSAKLPQTQPACITDSATLLYDCGNWAVSASWTVPTNATSGIYFVNLMRTDTGGNSHIVFVVRNDSSTSDMLFQTSDEAWQAYNDWGGSINNGVLGGNTLYGGPGAGNWTYTDRAYKVSYNRPFDTRAFEAASWVFGNEYPMVRWLEANGFNVTYFTHVDAIRNSTLITNHKIYLSVGHDEYWSGTERLNVTAAANAGVNLAFFSGNEVFWKTRWENSIDGSNTPYRTLVCYKETYPEAQIDPDDPPTWTGTWRDPTFSPPDDGGQPENGFTGTIFMVNGPGSDDTGISIKVPQADGQMRFWRNTSEAKLAAGATATLPGGTLGYEWDIDADNGFRPAGNFDLSTSTYNLTVDYLLDYGVTYGAGTATHHMTEHRLPSGALVFGAGTVQWPWGLDSNHDNTQGFATPAANKDMEQATINLFADMGVQPASIQSGLLLATKSTDTTPPTSVITSPTSGSNVSLGKATTVSGTATDSGGGVVGGVEVSVNSGQTWHPATGRGSWTYSFTPEAAGAIAIMSRATDDSGNIETPGPGVIVTAGTTYAISGTISPTAAGNGAIVNLTGSTTAAVTANSSGAYTISGLPVGSYTVTPSAKGYVFSPAETTVAVTSANVTGVNFTGSLSSGSTYSISGSVTPLPAGAGATITLSGTATASTFTNASGDFTISGLAAGSYTVTPSEANYAFSPPQSAETITNSSISGLTFTASATAESIFTTQSPASVNQSDGTSINYELGTLFQSSVAGQITAIRFWKDSKESGTHTGNLWSSTGTLLESVTFTNETASGWQVQNLATPVPVTANTTYVVSMNTAGTYYVDTTDGLTSEVVNGNLSTIVGNNGVYGSPGVFPTSTYEATNYFRDVLFAQAPVPVVTATAGTPQSATISTAFTTALQATVMNNGSPVSGATVTFTAPASGASGTFAVGVKTATTNSSGVATAPAFTANTSAGSYTVTASVTGASAPASFSLTNNAGAAASLAASAGTPQSAAINVGFATNLQATVKDASGNPVSGVTVTFTAPSTGASGLFGGTSATAEEVTNGSGQANAPPFVANGTTGSYTVTASAAGVTPTASFSLTNTTAPPGSITASAGTPQSATISSAFGTALQVTVLTTGGSPVSGATVTFTAPTNGASGTFAGGVNTATTNSSGVATAPTFTANTTAGSYTVTASVSGLSSTASFSLTNNPGPAASITATAGTPQTATISTAFATALQATVKDASNNPVSGVSVTFAALTSGASGTFSGTATVTTNSSGVATAPTFTANSTSGSYTVTATATGVSTAASFSLTNSATASIAIDVTTSTNRSTSSKTIASSSFSTASTNELLLALISADASSSGTNTTVSSISGGSLTWTLVERTDTQRGTAEIWRAFATAKLSSTTVTATLSASEAASMTVMSFTGVSTSGTNGSGAIGAVGTGNANPGAPAASLVTTQANSMVIGVGNDWDNAVARTVGPNQIMVNQYLATVGDTYWVQRVTTLSPAGTTVTVNDTPTTDRYNLSICETLP